ncbi:MOB-like protein phocein [Liparis tanakae]|uniref:MOB-like protein phocein n=1 Tax=Liparis tanakae TaxID=230148 RepID=A0A4Z2H7J1_9TELE|nr:MOB-like protein phocein [Liparis tanakae]
MAEGTAVLRRNRPGTKAKDFYNWQDESFEEMDSTLAVQQYIQQNIRSDCSNIDKILEPPEGQDEGVWKYEHLRQFCLELNGLAVKLQSECHPDTCTQMTATEQWIFLCAAHKTPKENETFLCHRFTRFVMKYNLMSKDNLIVPILEEEVGRSNSVSKPQPSRSHAGDLRFALFLLEAALLQVGQGAGVPAPEHRESPDAAGGRRRPLPLLLLLPPLRRDGAADRTTHGAAGHVAGHR